MTPVSTPTIPLPDRWPVIADELARRLEPATAVAQRYGMSNRAMRVLLQQPTFLDMLREARTRWEGSASIDQRLTLKGKHLLETNLPVLHDILQDDRAAPAARVAAFKELRGLTGVGQAGKEGATAGASFVLNIVLPGADGPSLVVEGTAVEEVGDEDDPE